VKRLSPALLTIIMLGVIGLLVTLYFGKKLLFANTAPAVEPRINIPMALTNLEPGTKITEMHIALGPAAPSKLSKDIVRTNRIVVGRVVKNRIEGSTPISTDDLYPSGEGPAPEIAVGMRAVTVPLAGLTGNVIQPGHYVDVHFTPTRVPNANQTGGLTMTLFKGVKVQALNGNTVGTDARGRTNDVTLELTPEQTNIILLAKDKGALNLVYTPEGKGFGNVALDNADRATLDQILGIAPPEEEEAKDPPYVTEVFSGAGRRMQSFRDGLRADRYAIERFDYNNRNNNNGWGGNGYNNYGNWGNNAPMPDFEFRGRSGGGYFSVPSGNGGNGGGANGANGGAGNNGAGFGGAGAEGVNNG